MLTRLLSFGFKHGLPQEAETVLDARVLPNPYYVEEMRSTTGLDPATAAYVLDNEKGRRYLARVLDVVDVLVQGHQEAGKKQFILALGCTGGRHRSVAVAEKIFHSLAAKGAQVTMKHRDLDL